MHFPHNRQRQQQLCNSLEAELYNGQNDKRHLSAFGKILTRQRYVPSGTTSEEQVNKYEESESSGGRQGNLPKWIVMCLIY